MSPARTITLFAPPPQISSGSSSWMVSLLAHVALCAWLYYGLVHTPQFQPRTVHQRFTLRVLNVPMTQPEVRQYAAAGSPVQPAAQDVQAPSQSISAPAPTAAANAKPLAPSATASPPAPVKPQPAALAPAAPAKPAPALPAAVQLAQTTHQQQTLIQPDAPKDLLLQHLTPVPLVLMWADHSPPPKVAAAPPQKTVVANMHSSLQLPNREPIPAEINLTSTPFHTAMPTLAPGTTSPLVVRGPGAVQQMPTVATQTIAPAAPVRILSLSDRQMQEGPVAVPLANASARPSPSQSLTAGSAETPGGAGRSGASGNQPNATAAAQNPASSSKPTGAGAATAPSAPGHGNSNGVATAAAGPSPNTGAPSANSGTGPASPQPSAGTGEENAASVKRIALPHDGRFGVVVVGSSLADLYPETAAIWNGRLVYTVYLNVGMGKSWILQYSLPPGSQAAASGSRPDAPWPYDIVVPKLDAGDFNSDALMVHGYVNPAGHFERTSVVLPADFPQAKFVLSALEQWQFRPASQNGQPTAVEVLLIVPEQD